MSVAVPASAPVAGLLATLTSGVDAAAGGRDDEFETMLASVSEGLFSLPPAWPVTVQLHDDVVALAENTSHRAAASGVSAVTMLLAWHLDDPDRLASATRRMVTYAADYVAALDPSREAAALFDQGQTVIMLTSLLGTLDAAPHEGVAVLARAGDALCDVPTAEMGAAHLLVCAARWLVAVGASPDPLRPKLARAAQGLLRHLDTTPRQPDTRDAMAICLTAFELSGDAVSAQHVRFRLVNGLLTEDMFQQAEPLLAKLREPIVMPDQDLHIGLLRARMLLARRELGAGRDLLSQLSSGLPPEHPAHEAIGQLRAIAAELAGDWAAASKAWAPTVEHLLTRLPDQDPDGSVGLTLLRAAHDASRIPDRATTHKLSAALAEMGARSVVGDFACPLSEGWLALLDGDQAHATSRIQAAVDAITAGLGPTPDRIAMQALLTVRTSALDQLADLAAAAGDAVAALTAAEAQRSEFLRAGSAARRRTGSVPGLATFLDACARATSTPTIESAATSLLASQAAAQLRQMPLRGLAASRLQPPVDVVASLARVHEVVGPTWAIASIGMGADGIWVVGSDGARVTVTRSSLNTHALMSEVMRLFSPVAGRGARPDDRQWLAAAETCLADLEAPMGAPLRDVLERTGRDRLLISLAGPLAAIPLSAVGTPAHRLVDSVSGLSVLPGLGWSAELAGRPRRDTDVITTSAVEDPTIPLARLEADLVAAAHRGTSEVVRLVPLDQLAITAAVARSRMVHLAAHASWDPVDVIRSGITLGAGDRLDSGELFAALPFDGADLAALSACDTGSGTMLPTGDHVNLASLLLMAGARQVVASHWPVSDESTLFTMSEFHRRVADGEPAAVALVAAQRVVRALTAADGLSLLDEWALDLAHADGVLSRLRAEWAQRASDATPFARLDAWAPFTCFGPPLPEPLQEGTASA